MNKSAEIIAAYRKAYRHANGSCKADSLKIEYRNGWYYLKTSTSQFVSASPHRRKDLVEMTARLWTREAFNEQA